MVLRPEGVFDGDRSDYGYFPVGKNEQEIKGGEGDPPLLEGLTQPQFAAFWKPWKPRSKARSPTRRPRWVRSTPTRPGPSPKSASCSPAGGLPTESRCS